jgi:hypothetical protein
MSGTNEDGRTAAAKLLRDMTTGPLSNAPKTRDCGTEVYRKHSAAQMNNQPKELPARHDQASGARRSGNGYMPVGPDDDELAVNRAIWLLTLF